VIYAATYFPVADRLPVPTAMHGVSHLVRDQFDREGSRVEVNALGQPVGPAVPGWTPRARPTRSMVAGSYCRLERLDPDRHTTELFSADQRDLRGESWTYLPYGPFADLASYRQWVAQVCTGDDPMFYAIIDTDTATGATEQAVGVLSYLRVQAEVGSIEVGHVHYSPLLQRRRGATEAQFLLMRHAFDAGYRRYEWKCDALNAPSRASAERLGFTYEGTFRQATIVKGRNRDTAWYSITDTEWPVIKDRIAAWLAHDNFDDQARQRISLRSSRRFP
jgi:RimJ/RimL family protein N-acetyltransferase